MRGACTSALDATACNAGLRLREVKVRGFVDVEEVVVEVEEVGGAGGATAAAGAAGVVCEGGGGAGVLLVLALSESSSLGPAIPLV